MIKKLLIANRGEIALRVIRAARESGIASVAVYTSADRASVHVRRAQEAYYLESTPQLDGYLDIDQIIGVAKRCGADSIHPGYGFLAENADFADACEAEKIVFVGPNPKAMRSLGSKTQARITMQGAGVPIVPGTTEDVGTPENALKVAEEVGYPVLLKAAAGGGGKGMRLVKDSGELSSGLPLARAEAEKAFGDATIYIEKAVVPARHIEVQLLADLHGSVVYLGERECSIQRRHQKLIEETPSPALDDPLRKRICETAVRVAELTGYTNAGTVEFLLGPDKTFYFLEVNARLQVEHCVSEMVTGIDIVKEQFRIASGEKLRFRQNDIAPRGASIECRIYAEDPDNNFLPSVGTLATYREPGGPAVRVDTGFHQGATVSMAYDPLLSKLLAWGEDRPEAIERMKRALTEYQISGVATTIGFHQFVMNNESYAAGEFDTGFVEREWLGASPLQPETAEVAAIAAAAAAFADGRVLRESEDKGYAEARSGWKDYGRREGLRKSL
jgi:acetyl-CoA carboxylase biotin carboxylase subunit